MSGERSTTGSGSSIASMGAYSQPVADSVVTPEGTGRVRGDTLVFRTAQTSIFGSHEWRYARVATP